jgi:hypothetical protein
MLCALRVTMASFLSLLARRREAVTERWLSQILPTDPKKSPFPQVRRQQDPFANPMVHKLTVGTRAVVDALLAGAPPAEVEGPLLEMVKLRSVQDLTPAEAVSFIFQLKDAISDELRAELKAGVPAAELLELFGRIDQVALLAFDIYMRCRERICEIRVNEARRQVSGQLRRAERLDRKLRAAKDRGSS